MGPQIEPTLTCKEAKEHDILNLLLWVTFCSSWLKRFWSFDGTWSRSQNRYRSQTKCKKVVRFNAELDSMPDQLGHQVRQSEEIENLRSGCTLIEE
jgi:hypothetical protein